MCELVVVVVVVAQREVAYDVCRCLRDGDAQLECGSTARAHQSRARGVSKVPRYCPCNYSPINIHKGQARP